jgi:hypothetical protein
MTDLELRDRLAHFHAAYSAAKEHGARTDSAKRLAAINTLAEVAAFLRANGLPAELVLKVAEALFNVENGTPVPWLENNTSGRPPIPIKIRSLRAKAAARMEILMRPGPNKLQREQAAREVAKKIPRNGSMFKGCKGEPWESVALWRDEIKKSPRSSLEWQTFQAVLKT